MIPDDDVPWQLLERYCSGHVTPEDVAQLESWLAGDPRRRALLERLRTLFVRQVPRPTASDIEREWARLAAALDEGPKHAWPAGTRSRWARPLVVGVGVLVLLGIAWYVVRVAGR